MWPYDYFNQYSNIEIDDKIGDKKKVFLAIWYGGDCKKDQDEQERRCCAFVKVIREMNFEPIIANRIKKGDFNQNILTEIIDSTFIVCDITPIDTLGTHDVFNPNVMVELGLALAWKMKEQVIVLWDDNVSGFPDKLVFDLHDYQVDKIDKEYKSLPGIIEKRLKDFDWSKDMLIRNIKSKIDTQCLRLLEEKHHGLMISLTPGLDALHCGFYPQIARIRHLINLGVLRFVIFPKKENKKTSDHIYAWTKIGKIVLKQLAINIYPDILIDIDSLVYWRGYEDQFKNKLAEFEKAYGVPWENIIKDIVSLIDSEAKEYIKNAFKPSEDSDIFYNYLRVNSYDTINEKIILKLRNSNKTYAQFF